MIVLLRYHFDPSMLNTVLSWLDRWQIAAYLLAIFLGIALGLIAPQFSDTTAALINPLLMLLLYQTFLGVPLNKVKDGLADTRFLRTLLLGNFILAPIMVGLGSLALTNAHPAILVGFVFVLVCPCVDYVLVFSDIAGGDTPRLTAATPLLMLCQMLLLPLYL